MKLELRSETRDDGIMTLWLNCPERSVVVLDEWLLDQLHLFFDWLDKQARPKGFILASASERVFVAGADLAEIESKNDEQLHAYLTEGAHAFARIATLPCPTVAAINGAALGGGLEIAMHCDAMIAALPGANEKPYRVGLPEAGLGLCPGWGGTQMLPARIDPALAIRMTATGETVKVTDAPAGLFDGVVSDAGSLLSACAKWIKDHPKATARTHPRALDERPDAVRAGLTVVQKDLPATLAAQAVVEAVEAGLDSGWKEGIAAERRLLVGLRHTEPAREKLEAFFAKSGRG